MKDFMTKISDYLNERRNDPERRENQLSIVIIGAVAVVVIILLLLLFWTYTVKRTGTEAEGGGQRSSVGSRDADESACRGGRAGGRDT